MTTLLKTCNYSTLELDRLEEYLLENNISFITLRLTVLLENNLNKISSFPAPIINWSDYRIKDHLRSGLAGFDSKPRDIEWWKNAYIAMLNEGVIGPKDLNLSDYSSYELVLLRGSYI